MLPMPTDNGARLAAVFPTALASIALGRHAEGLSAESSEDNSRILETSGVTVDGTFPPDLPALRSVVVIVVDGLGYANLRSVRGHAQALSSLPTRRIETVIPSTTGAALTSITTGQLPGVHGLVGYRIRHSELGLITTLKGWDGIDDPRSWQRAEPLFAVARAVGARPVAIGRPAHADGGLTAAILTGAEYLGGQTITDRFAIVSRLLREGEPLFAYLYVDELDKLAHSDGWQSEKWVRRLEQFDRALEDVLRTLPGDVGVVVTADHGVVDIPTKRRLLLDDGLISLEGVELIGGEPRLRSLYLRPGEEPARVAERVAAALGKLAWVGTRDEAIAANWFGPVADSVAPRIGEVLIAARSQVAFMIQAEGPAPLQMVAQHGSLSDEERGVPLALAGPLAGSGFASALERS